MTELADVKLQYLLDFINQCLTAGYTTSGINGNLRNIYGFLNSLQAQDYPVTQPLLRMSGLNHPDPLSKFSSMSRHVYCGMISSKT